MTFLPIVERELRVAARKQSTFWLRVTAALVALVIGGGFFMVGWIASSSGMGAAGIGMVSLGKGLFVVLTWLCLGVALCGGIFFTSDCLSEEKREGTLGFLFLTDLRGYDVVLGKLLATSLRGCFALLAVLPVLAVTLLMGAVAGPEFWKTILALVNALFCSLAVGMLVSVLSRDAQRAMLVTLGLVFILTAGGPIVDGLIAGDNPRGFRAVLSLASPAYAFVMAGRWAAQDFWSALAVSHAAGWSLLAATCVLAPQTWQEKSARKSRYATDWAYWWKFGGDKRRAAVREKFLDRNPAGWLACRERWQSVTLWVFTILTSAGFGYLLLKDLPTEMWMIWSYAGGALTLVLYLGVASQAGRFFVEARRNGLLELLLATPLPARRMADGQWRALLRLFGLPVVIFLGLNLLATMLSQQAWSGIMTGIGGKGPHPTLTAGMAVVTAVVTALNLAALAWFGMWMGLTSRSANLATLKTIVFVQVIPWLVISFVSSVLMWLLMIRSIMPAMTTGTVPNPAGAMLWYPILNAAVAAALSLGKDVFFIVWARRKLFSDFRELAIRAVAPVRLAPPAGPLPPIISQP